MEAAAEDLGLDEMLRERAATYGMRPPPRWMRLLEARAVLEATALLPASPWLLSQPRGDGHRVVVIPGFLCDDRSTVVLRSYLKALGYKAEPWGRGVNKGYPEEDAAALAQSLEGSGPFTLVGWSLGGLIARVVAQALPAATRHVVTLGTPVEGGPKFTAGAGVLARLNPMPADEIERRAHLINRKGIRAPITAIYCRSDGVVGWQAAQDRYNDGAEHVRVPSSHLGLVLSPLVLAQVALALGRHSAG